MPSTATTNRGQACRGQGHGRADGCFVCDSETDPSVVGFQTSSVSTGFRVHLSRMLLKQHKCMLGLHVSVTMSVYLEL